MSLKDEIITYIEETGVAAVAEELGKSEQTVKLWLKTGRLPGELYEKFLEWKSMDTAPAAVAPAVVASVTPVVTLEDRVARIEEFLVQMTQAPAPSVPRITPNALNAPWIPPDPTDSNVRSFVNPSAGIAGQTLTTGARDVTVPTPTAPTVQPGLPSQYWLTPRKA